MPDVAASNLDSDSLVHAIQSCNWKDYESGLRQSLFEQKSPTEEADRRFAKVTAAIDRQIATSNGFGDPYCEWRTRNARIILSSYTPISTQLLARLTSNLSLSQVFVRGAMTPPDTENRLTDAKLILRSFQIVSDFVEADFDPRDPDNQPLSPIPVPGGDYLPGTALASIADPKVREAYMWAIAENHAKAERINAQLQAREDSEKIRQAARRFLREAYGQPPAAFEELKELLNRLGDDPIAKANIVRKAEMSVPKIEMKLKENRQNEDALEKLKAEGLID